MRAVLAGASGGETSAEFSVPPVRVRAERRRGECGGPSCHVVRGHLSPGAVPRTRLHGSWSPHCLLPAAPIQGLVSSWGQTSARGFAAEGDCPPSSSPAGTSHTASHGLGTHAQDSRGSRSPCWSHGRGLKAPAKPYLGRVSCPPSLPFLLVWATPGPSRTLLQGAGPLARRAIRGPWTKARGQKTSPHFCSPHSCL